MLPKKKSIKSKLLRVVLIVNGAVLLLTCTIFFAYEYVTFRQSRLRELSSIAQILAANSTAALAFDDRDAANEILNALQAETKITAACLYDIDGKLFTVFPNNLAVSDLPSSPDTNGFAFSGNTLSGFHPVTQGNQRLGTIYVRYSIDAIYERLQVYAILAFVIIILSTSLSYVLYRRLQNGISKPILALAETAHAIANRQDFSVRAVKESEDEVGLFTDAFNQMLNQIQKQNTELSESSEAIRTFNQKLEQMVIDRTSELDIANKELESFSYSVSHDLRAPLRSIHGYVNILHEEYGPQLDDEAKRLISIILRNGQRMGQLIDDLLAFSKLGRKEISKSDISMYAMAQNVIDDFKRTETSERTHFTINRIPAAEADITTIRQVWVNLISNAIKYSSQHETPVVEIGAFEKDGVITYYVKDNGAGFDMAYYDKLFGVFQRLHSGKDFEGTGVGLAIVQRIISKHGGRIWAQSKVNEGATFYFTLNNTKGH